MPKKIKIIFLGTSAFGVPLYEAIGQDARFELVLTVSQPDARAGRGRQIRPSTIKTIAQKHNWPVITPAGIKDASNTISSLRPDLLVLCSYGQIVPSEILAIPRFKALNIHASPLPRYRGAACVQAAILNGDQESGLTLMQMDTGFDTGPIIAQKKIKLNGRETSPLLLEILSQAAPDFFRENIILWLEQKITPRPQVEKDASYAPKLTKEDGLIDWQQPNIKIDRQVRALLPWPGTYTFLPDRKYLKILSGFPGQPVAAAKPGEIQYIGNEFAVACLKSYFILGKIQLSGGRPLEAKIFFNGHKEYLGKNFFSAPDCKIES